MRPSKARYLARVQDGNRVTVDPVGTLSLFPGLEPNVSHRPREGMDDPGKIARILNVDGALVMFWRKPFFYFVSHSDSFFLVILLATINIQAADRAKCIADNAGSSSIRSKARYEFWNPIAMQMVVMSVRKEITSDLPARFQPVA